MKSLGVTVPELIEALENLQKVFQRCMEQVFVSGHLKNQHREWMIRRGIVERRWGPGSSRQKLGGKGSGAHKQKTTVTVLRALEFKGGEIRQFA